MHFQHQIQYIPFSAVRETKWMMDKTWAARKTTNWNISPHFLSTYSHFPNLLFYFSFILVFRVIIPIIRAQNICSIYVNLITAKDS